MAKKNSFNISTLYKEVFGITGVRFAIPNRGTVITAVKASEFAAGQAENEKLQQAAEVKKYAGIQTIPAPSGPSIQSFLGTPIYEQITLSVPSVITNGVVTSQGFEYTFPDWPLFDINENWQIQKENTQGGGAKGGGNDTIGTVKEFVQQDDFAITLRGIIINYESYDYPDRQVADLRRVLDAQRVTGLETGITSRVFNLFGIHNVVFTAARWPGVEGYMNMQPFEIDCLSDYPQLLQIKSTKTQKIIVPGL